MLQGLLGGPVFMKYCFEVGELCFEKQFLNHQSVLAVQQAELQIKIMKQR